MVLLLRLRTWVLPWGVGFQRCVGSFGGRLMPSVSLKRQSTRKIRRSLDGSAEDRQVQCYSNPYSTFRHPKFFCGETTLVGCSVSS